MLRRTFAVAWAVLVLSTLTSTDANAAAQRTFVASYGVSTNTAFSCSIAKPCRQFSEAVGVTNAGGEVIVLDSAGYGPATINQSVSIIAPAGIYAGISVFTGNGITINGTNIVVKLSGLSINGQGGAYGIVFTSGTGLIVDRCTISNIASVGILIKGTSPVKATLTNVRIDNSSTGVEANDNADVVIADSQISYSTQGVAVGPVTVGLPVQAHIERTIIEHSTVHAVAVYSGGVAYISGCQLVSNGSAGVWADIGGSLAYVTDSRIVGNDKGVWQVNSGAIVLSNNVISGNKAGGVRQDDPGLIYTMKNNTVRDNAGNILGGPLTTLTFD